MIQAKKTLLRLLRNRAYREGEFELSSGRTSDYYLDGKLLSFEPEGIDPIGEVFLEAILPHEVDAVGGLTMGADPIVTSVAATAHRRGVRIPAFAVRKDSKEHGLRKSIEGPFPDAENPRVAIVDDVVTSGGSLLQAVDAVEEAGGRVAVVVALVDRRAGGRERIEEAGYRFESIFTIDDIRSPESSLEETATTG